MTTKDSILALAAKISNGTVPNVATDAQALGELAKAMCGSAPTEPIATVDDAIAFITANYSGGGGGGVDVGPLTLVVKNNSAPEVEEYLPASTAIGKVAIGDAVIVARANVTMAAAGVTATTAPDLELEPTTCDAYVVTVNSGVITASAPWDGTLTPSTVTAGPATLNIWSFTVPALTLDETTVSGQALYLYMH